LNALRTLLLAAILVAALAAAPAQAAPTRLVATVGPGFTITLTKAGKKVKTLKPGRYVITVRDKSAAHNFHLRGPGLNKMTTVGAVTTRTWTVTLKKGTFRYVCDPHATSMKGILKVA
jgi:plastocyanin